MPSAVEQTELLARRIMGMLDAQMRTAYLRHTLLTMPPHEVADLLSIARAYAEARQPRHAELLTCMSLALSHETCRSLRQAVAAVLSGRDEPSLARSLCESGPLEDEEAQRIPDFGMGRPVTLGERKSLARRNDRELIARVLRDPHPDVMRILLGNPRLTENDVLRLCARRPVASEVLREVWKSARWIVRYPIKVALVLNPYTPLDIGLQLVPHLHGQDVRRVLAAADLSPDLQAACRQRPQRERMH
jgi:hypothetical protein